MSDPGPADFIKRWADRIESTPGVVPDNDEILAELARLDQLIVMNKGLEINDIFMAEREVLLRDPGKYYELQMEISAEMDHEIEQERKSREGE